MFREARGASLLTVIWVDIFNIADKCRTRSHFGAFEAKTAHTRNKACSFFSPLLRLVSNENEFDAPRLCASLPLGLSIPPL